jgi:hypothetical protein
MESLLLNLLLMRKPSVLTENLGRELPTGSKKRELFNYWPFSSYLNVGTGEP